MLLLENIDEMRTEAAEEVKLFRLRKLLPTPLLRVTLLLEMIGAVRNYVTRCRMMTDSVLSSEKHRTYLLLGPCLFLCPLACRSNVVESPSSALTDSGSLDSVSLTDSGSLPNSASFIIFSIVCSFVIASKELVDLLH